jgi:hypothetical protein
MGYPTFIAIGAPWSRLRSEVEVKTSEQLSIVRGCCIAATTPKVASRRWGPRGGLRDLLPLSASPFPPPPLCNALDKLDERCAHFPAWEAVKCPNQSKRSGGRQELPGFTSGRHAGLSLTCKEEWRRHIQSLSNPCEAANRDPVCAALVLLHLLERDAYAFGQIGLT